VSLVPEQLDLTIVYEPGEDGWVVASIPEVRGVANRSQCEPLGAASRRTDIA
jgi:hypothetical protein